MRPKPISLLVSMLLVALLLNACGQTQTEPTLSSTPLPRVITVSGTGKVYLNPDIATITIGVHTENESATRAVNSNNSQAERVAEVLIEIGVDEEDIQTSNFNIFPQQQYDDLGNLTGIVYIVDNSVFVTVRDLELLGEILGTVVEAGANSIFGIQFDVSDKTRAISKARKAAIEDAQIKAEELAQAAGVTLGEVQSINEYGGIPVPVFEGKGGGGLESSEAQVPVSLGQLSLTVQVTVNYNIH